jgi:hypothetical protein
MPIETWTYDLLRPETKRVIDGWLERAWVAKDCPDSESFEPFIYCWIAFNSWGACVTKEDSDRKMIAALQEDTALNEQFHNRIVSRTDPFAGFAFQFQSLWPIFKVQDLRRKNITPCRSRDRTKVINEYLAGGATEYAPKDAASHGAIGIQIPLTWPNTLSAIYRARCNLFHGEKSAGSEMDQLVVGSAYRVLVHFFHDLVHPDEDAS